MNNHSLYNRSKYFLIAALLAATAHGMDLPKNYYALAECDAKSADAQNQFFTIADFNWETDRQRVIEILKKNWGACVSDDSTYDHSTVLHIFKDGESANKSGQQLSIKVLKDSNNVIVGFITYVGYQYWPAPGGGYYDKFRINNDGTPFVNAGHIELLAVDEAYRRSGAASMLIRYAINHLKEMGAKEVNIYVNNTNEPALRCYQKLGFVVNPSRSPFDHVTFLDKSL